MLLETKNQNLLCSSQSKGSWETFSRKYPDPLKNFGLLHSPTDFSVYGIVKGRITHLMRLILCRLEHVEIILDRIY